MVMQAASLHFSPCKRLKRYGLNIKFLLNVVLLLIFSKNWQISSAMHLSYNNTPFFFKSFQKISKSTFSKTGAKLKYYACNKTFFSPQQPDYQ